jgi:hypothetical protein
VAWLRDNPPVRSQFRSPRRLHLSPKPGRLTGCTVLHTAESVADLVGPDASAEGVARFIRNRTDPGSYHDLVDRDSTVQLVRYGDEAFQDGTGSNPWAMSISWALKAADWPRLSTKQRDEYLLQGAVAFRRQQAWLRLHLHPTTPLRRISKPLSDAGAAGFISHGERDPGRRSDPGRDFPWARWFQVLGSKEDDDMTPEQDAMLRQVHAELTRREPHRLPEVEPDPAKRHHDTLFGWVLNAQTDANRAQRAALAAEAAVRSLAAQLPGVSEERVIREIRAAIDKAISDRTLVAPPPGRTS